MSDWIRVIDRSPPEGQIVDTKIEDKDGARNYTFLKCENNLWWAPDSSMYVYYTPTHWRMV